MKTVTTVALAAAAFISVPASAATFVVAAQGNSSTGGTGLATIGLAAGQVFTVTAGINDLWSAGALPRFSDANGLVGDRFATAADDSGQPVGTQIGTNFGTLTLNGFAAPYGALVGQIGTNYYLLGTNFSGVAATAGVLNLYYWDSNNGDNSGTITANVNGIAAVPEATTWAMIIAGFSVAGVAMRRRRRRAVAQLV